MTTEEIKLAERLIIENNQLRQDKERLELALAETERRYRMAKGICVDPEERMERVMRGTEG